MLRANVRRVGAAGLLFVCLIALPGRAGADDRAEAFDHRTGDGCGGRDATYTVSLTDGTDACDRQVQRGPEWPTTSRRLAYTSGRR